MAHEETVTTIEGEISDVFAHRFVVRTADGSVLADLGPKGAKKAAPRDGDEVRPTGQQTHPFGGVRRGRRWWRGRFTALLAPERRKGWSRHLERDGHQTPSEFKVAIVERAGETIGIEGSDDHKDEAVAHHEHHVALDGEVRKIKAGDPADDKWKPSKKTEAA